MSDLPNTSGIYIMYFDGLDDKYYVGKASSLSNRYSSHISKLKHEKHPNYLLQKYFLRLGYPVLHILELCSICSLNTREIYWIDKFDSFNSGLNLTPGGEGAGLGEEHPNALYEYNCYANILLELAYTNKTAREISRDLKVSETVVQDISCMSTHTYLQESYPQAFSILKEKLGKRVSGSSSAYAKGIVLPLVVDPLGGIHEVRNIAEFSRTHGLDRSALQRLLRYKAKSHLGWRIYE